VFKDKPRIENGQLVEASSGDLATLVHDIKAQIADVEQTKANTQPRYKLDQKLRDMELTLRYPNLTPKERRRMRGPTDPRNFGDERVPRGNPRKK
jgi:hypothetical protein